MRWSIVLFVLASCGGDAATTDGGGGSGSNTGSGSNNHPADAALYPFNCGLGSACTTDDVCCTTVGTTTSVACSAVASCPAADQVKCDGPSECSGSTPVCCGVDVPNGGSYPSCNTKSIGASCTSAAACPTHIATNCTETSKVQLCKVPSDCTDPDSPECCTFASNGASLTFCTDSTTASFGGGTCH